VRKRTTATVVAGFAAIAVLVAAPIARAETVRIGSALNLPYQGGVCNNNCLSVQQSQAVLNFPHPILSPVNGVITEWKVRTGDPDALYTLRVLTPAAGNAYISTTSLAAPAPVPAGTVDSILTYFATRTVAIQQGQAIGVLQTNGGGAGADVGLPQNTTNGITTNGITNNFNGTFLDGLGAIFISDQQHELLLQAIIRFCRVPNVTGLTLAAAQQAITTAECTPTATKKKLKRSKKNKKKKGKVLSQSLPADSTAPPGSPVDLTLAALKKKQ
jgi:PASTA domain-containing protein